MQIHQSLSLHIKLKSKWMKDLHIKPDTLKLIKTKLGRTLDTCENFLNRIPTAYALRIRVNKYDLIKLKRFCKAKYSRTKQQLTDGEKMFTNSTSDRGLISNIYKELKKLHSRKPNKLTKSEIQS